MKTKAVIAMLLFVCLLGCSGQKETQTQSPASEISKSPEATEALAAQTPQPQLADPYEELPAFDFSDDAGSDTWTLVAQIGGTSKAVCQQGDYVYVGSGMSVVVLNASDKQNIFLSGTSKMLPDNIQNITGDGTGHLFVSCGSGGFVVISVINPTEPKIIGYLDTLGFTENVTIHDGYAYLADGPCGIQIADISDVTNPVWVSEAYPLAYVRDIAVQDNRAYAAAGGSGILVVDISNPAEPGEVGLVETGGFQYGVDIYGGKLYSAGAWGGITVVDLSDPFDASRMETVAVDGWAMNVSVVQDELFVVQGTSGVALYDTSDLQKEPRSVYSAVEFIADGAFDGSYAFLFDRERGVLAIDFSGGGEPELLGSWMPLLDGRRAVCVDNAVYVAGGLSGLHVYDIANPSNPLETYWWDTTGGYARSFAFGDDNMLYLGNHMGGQCPLVGFDISDPLEPKYVNDLPDEGGGEYESILFNAGAFLGLTFQKGYVYAAAEWALTVVDVRDESKYIPVFRDYGQAPLNIDSNGDLLAAFSSCVWLYDISTPDNPLLLSSFTVSTSGQGIKFVDSETLLAADDMSFLTLDISDPTNIVKKARTETSGQVMGIYIDGTTAYMATLGGGIDVFDITNPYEPIFIENIKTIGSTYDCFISGDVLLAANSSSGVGVYVRTETLESATSVQEAKAGSLALTLPENSVDSEEYVQWEMHEPSVPATEFVVTSTADSGDGTLREALSMDTTENLHITFDTSVFSPDDPATIMLESSLPVFTRDFLTIDASNAGVILDGSQMSDGDGLTIFGSKCTVMGLQMYNFPSVALRSEGVYNQIGGNRNIGEGPTGQGNVLSGNRTGLQISQTGSVVLGNIIGLDAAGTKAAPNYQGVYVSGYEITVGSVNPGENNIISGNTHGNLNTWGDKTRIIGNYLGLDITGTKAVSASDSAINMVIESGAKNCVVGGTTPEERNIISGSCIGVVFSDPNTYQCSVIGNYFGTDVTGTKAIPNGTAVLYFQSGNNRVGGTAPGEANLISGNTKAVQMSSLGYTDNIFIGNIVGLDANGDPLSNTIGVAIQEGENQAVIGGYTAKEGNTLIASPVSISETGTECNYIAGNTISNASEAGVFVSGGSGSNFIQCNTFLKTKESVRIDLEQGNMVRSNLFESITQYTIFLVDNGNNSQPAPQVLTAAGGTVTGTTCAFGLVEVYRVDSGSVIPIGFARADAEGNFSFAGNADLTGKKIALLVTSTEGNTSAFTNPIKMEP